MSNSAGKRFRFFRETISMDRDEMAVFLDRSSSAIADIELGKAQVRAPHLEKLSIEKNLNINWLLTGRGEMFFNEDKQSGSMVSEPQSTYVPGKRDISSLLEDIDSRLSPEDQKLVRHLKVEIDEVIKERDDAIKEKMKANDELIALLTELKGKLNTRF